jgi:hypothetical protein
MTRTRAIARRREEPDRGRDEMRRREDRGRRDHNGLVERAQREQRADRQETAPAGALVDTNQEGKGPDDAGIDEHLGVGLVGLEPHVSGNERPEGGAPETGDGPGNRRRRGVHAKQRDDGGADIQEIDGARAVAHQQDRERVGDVKGRRLVIPQVGVELTPSQQFVSDHRRDCDVQLERLVVCVQARDGDQQGERKQRQSSAGRSHRGPGGACVQPDRRVHFARTVQSMSQPRGPDACPVSAPSV